MFSVDPARIPEIVNDTGFTIVYFDSNEQFPTIQRSIILEPNDKGTISIEDVREIFATTQTKQSTTQTYIVKHADKMTEPAANALLKLLEEPGNNIHIAFFITSDHQLLPTIKSRAHVFTATSPIDLDKLRETDQEIIKSARELISATPAQLVQLSAKLAKNRAEAQQVVNSAIDMTYKSYFKTGNKRFISTLDKLMNLSDALASNGHVRLHLAADML